MASAVSNLLNLVFSNDPQHPLLPTGASEVDSGPKGWRVMLEDEDQTKTDAAAAREKLRIMVIHNILNGNVFLSKSFHISYASIVCVIIYVDRNVKKWFSILMMYNGFPIGSMLYLFFM